MNENEQLIDKFYTAFASGNAEEMIKCYDKNIIFKDVVFGQLYGQEVVAMWTMLLEKSKGNMKIVHNNVSAQEHTGKATWIATYIFSQTGRTVVNTINAEFEIQNGYIVKHTDDFDIWKWCKQAFGFKGLLLGWTGFMQKKVQESARGNLKKYMENRNMK